MIKQKRVSLFQAALILFASLLMPIFTMTSAFAYAKGTCFILVQGSSQQTGTCKSFVPQYITQAQYKKLDPNKCYAYSASESASTPAPVQTPCDGKGVAGTLVTTNAAVSCTDGTQDAALCSPDCQGSSDCNLTKKYINPLINKFLAPLALLSVVIGIIWGSIEFATSAGDAQRAASGKGKIQKALIGLLAFIFLYAFLQYLIPGGLI